MISGFQYPTQLVFTVYVHSPTGPGFVSMSPHINSSRSTTNLTTLFLPPAVGGGLRETLKKDDVYDGYMIFYHAILFWRTMAATLLLRDGSASGAWLKVMRHRRPLLIGFM